MPNLHGNGYGGFFNFLHGDLTVFRRSMIEYEMNIMQLLKIQVETIYRIKFPLAANKTFPLAANETFPTEFNLENRIMSILLNLYKVITIILVLYLIIPNAWKYLNQPDYNGVYITETNDSNVYEIAIPSKAWPICDHDVFRTVIASTLLSHWFKTKPTEFPDIVDKVEDMKEVFISGSYVDPKTYFNDDKYQWDIINEYDEWIQDYNSMWTVPLLHPQTAIDDVLKAAIDGTRDSNGPQDGYIGFYKISPQCKVHWFSYAVERNNGWLGDASPHLPINLEQSSDMECYNDHSKNQVCILTKNAQEADCRHKLVRLYKIKTMGLLSPYTDNEWQKLKYLFIGNVIGWIIYFWVPFRRQQIDSPQSPQSYHSIDV